MTQCCEKMPPGQAGKHDYTTEKQRQSTTRDTGMWKTP